MRKKIKQPLQQYKLDNNIIEISFKCLRIKISAIQIEQKNKNKCLNLVRNLNGHTRGQHYYFHLIAPSAGPIDNNQICRLLCIK